MKKIITFISCLSILSFSIAAQDLITEGGGEYLTVKNDANNPCITPEQYKQIEAQNIENCARLGLKYGAQKNMTTTFSWPLKTANGLTDCSYYYIGNYLDQDTTSPGIRDYNCGTVTYDGHMGTDICTSPYPFYKMDNNQVEVIAAAAGTIINRSDGYFDKNCAGNNNTANYVIIQHGDGSCAMYWHMKLNSVTAKAVGQTVVTGEYLGVVGSSGSSSGPHLHFEVLNGITLSTLNDAFAGPCNTLNANSWWALQKPYTEPAIINASLHPISAVFPACPATETPNEDTCFAPGAVAKLYIFIRNETAGLVANMRIINPGGSTYTTWVHNSNSSYNMVYWFTTRTLPSAAGTYTFEAIYNGITCTKTFQISCGSSGVTNNAHAKSLQIYPNPSGNTITVQSEEELGTVSVLNSLGETVYKEKIPSKQHLIDISKQAPGVYFIESKNRFMKFVKE